MQPVLAFVELSLLRASHWRRGMVREGRVHLVQDKPADAGSVGTRPLVDDRLADSSTNTTFEYKLATADWSQSARAGMVRLRQREERDLNAQALIWDHQTGRRLVSNNQRRVAQWVDPLQLGLGVNGELRWLSTV